MVTTTTCACGAPIWIRKSGECQRCYHRRYRNEHRGEIALRQADHYEAKKASLRVDGSAPVNGPESALSLRAGGAR